MNKFVKRFTFIILLSIISIFYFIPVSQWDIIRLIAIITIGIVAINIRCLFNNKGKFANTIIFFLILCVIQTYLSIVSYKQSIKDVVVTGIYYFVFLIYYVISYYGSTNNIKSIRKTFIRLSLILSSILILQFFIYEVFGITFLALDLSESRRFGELRITSGSFFISIGVILATAEIIYNKYKDKIMEKIVFLLGIIEILFVAKTRSLLVFLGISLAIMFIFSLKLKKERIKMILVLTITLFIIINIPIMKKYKELGNVEQWSTIARKGAIEYYINQIKDKPIFGVGFINTTTADNSLFYYARGPLGIYYRDDVGIIGFTNCFGMAGLVWYITLIFKISKIIILKIKTKIIYNQPQVIGLATFFIVCSLSLIFMDIQRIVYLPFILCMIEE